MKTHPLTLLLLLLPLVAVLLPPATARSPPRQTFPGAHGRGRREQYSQLDFGDVIVPLYSSCPAGLREGAPHGGSKVCHGQGCTPGAIWKVNRDCSTCVCTRDGEPACTPCRREATEHTLTCETGLPQCPADCGRTYDAERDCYNCVCGVGEEGDIVVSLGEPCPPGTEVRANGAFTKACAPLDALPQGDTKLCGRQECPADCGTVRISRQENCAYCQCGPVLARGDEAVPLDQECRAPSFAGAVQLVTKVCKAPTRQECRPGTTYNLDCDICICQDDGVPACTRRDCTLPKYGDTQVCDARYRTCPADCGEAGADSYCQYCQCGPRLREGDIVVAIDDSCPPGFEVSANQWATKTCSPVPGCANGPAYMDECTNICRCVDGVYACGRKACPPGKSPYKPLRCHNRSKLPWLPSVRVFCHEGIVKIQDRDKPCVPNSWSMDAENCNRCNCLSNGAEACTLKACIQLPPVCEYGPAYMDECTNVCRCVDGVYACDRKGCPPGKTASRPLRCDGSTKLPWLPSVRVFCHEGIVKIQDRDKPCVPNSWSMDAENCNTCNCLPNGAEACTLKACIQLPHRCEYGPAYMDECTNVCRCVGGGYACDRKGCPPGKSAEKPLRCHGRSKLPWLPSVRVYCHKGIVKVQSRDEACVPNSWSMDAQNCNRCNCLPNGVDACTRKACIHGPRGGY